MKRYKNADSNNRIKIAVVDYAILILIAFVLNGICLFTAITSIFNLNLSFGFAFVPIMFSNFFIVFVLGIIYFTVIPYYWSKQTIGRAIFKCKVVKKNNEELDFKDHALRFIVGDILFNFLNSVLILGIIIQIVLISKEPVTTLHDKIADTKMVDLMKSENNSDDPFKDYSDDFFDDNDQNNKDFYDFTK